MMSTFLSFFQKPPTSISVPVYPPYYEVSDKKGNLVACISGTHHNLVPDSRFEPAPTMQKCFDRANTLLVENDITAVQSIVKRELLKEGISAQSIDESFREAERNRHSIDKEWEERAKAQGKPIKGLESPINALRAAEKVALEEENTPDQQQQQCLKWTRDFLSGSDVKTRDYFQHCFINHNTTLKEFVTRNQVMASGINQSIRAGNLPFVAVGFGHCLGKKGVPRILKEQYGLDVREIKPNPPSLVHVSNPRYTEGN